MTEAGNKTTNRTGTILKFIVFSLIGVFIFFVNITIGEKTTVPLIHCIDTIKGKIVGTPNMLILVMILTISTCITSMAAKFGNEKNQLVAALKKHHQKDSAFSYFTYFTAAIFSVMVVFNVGPGFIIDPAVGNSSVKVASDVVAAVIIASFLVTFLVEFGLLEFLGKIIEPIMRVLFKIPGKAAVDALSSFVASPAVGVMITSNLYKKKVYTEKEACSITTNFSFCSIGAFAFLSSIAGCGDYFNVIVVVALLLGFVMAAIMIRIPILCWKKDVYYDGTVQTPEERRSERYGAQTIPSAIKEGLEKADGTSVKIFGTALFDGVKFAQKVSAYVVSLSVICLAVAAYTPIVNYIGKPIVPLLNLLGVPEAAAVAPGVLLGFFALSLPSTLAGAAGVSAMAAFFVVIVSTSQIIFFTESANAMLDSEIPLSFWDLLRLFLIRTALLIPLAAIVMHLVF